MRSPRGIHTFYNPTTKTWSGKRNPPLYNPQQTLGELIVAILARTPNHITQISTDSGARVTCSEMRLRTIRTAQNLTNMGYTHEDVFTMAVKNDELLAPVLFACFTLGIPVNTLDASFKRDDFSYMLTTVKPKVVFCDQDALNEMEAAIQTAGIEPVVILFGKKIDGYMHIQELMNPTGKEEPFVPPHFDDSANRLAIILCSSGTTGRSKGVCLSHSVCIANLLNGFQCYPSDVLFCFSSLYWLSGLAFLISGTISGATRIITRESYDPSLALDIIEKYRVSLTMFSPATTLEILKHPLMEKTNLSSIRAFVCGGAAVPASMKHSFERIVPNATFHVGYGLSEAGGVVTLTDNDCYKDGTTGYINAACQARIIDDSGHPLDIGQEGEIALKMTYNFMGYFGNEDATREILDSEGWLHTGDIGRFDEDGLLYVIDRKKDIIKYNGYQISPSEIESVIQSMPGIINVCVTGVPVPGSDLPAALVVKSNGTDVDRDGIHQLVENKLGSYKQLRGGVYFTSVLPMTPSGKILRRKCRDIVTGMYNCNNVESER
ncbi:uncharacterized protein LOC129762263 isoform X2 [Toxorhynchites rutilus septentrionalis]|nr:uncharacterized protein LOC129762263 isoform X2 [Toxorhynchites rutilus septentrionalis]XP_055616339.1 uncharacterized protein LOC129762263 isoform X2 [Toxorhynchites rutilus septentrionalis]